MSNKQQTEMFEKNRDIQDMVNDFLMNNHMPTITEMMAKSDKKEVLGVLTQTHKIVLQQMIKHEYPDIDDRIRSSRGLSDGRGQVLGVLTNIEYSLIEQLLERYRETKILMATEIFKVRTY